MIAQQWKLLGYFLQESVNIIRKICKLVYLAACGGSELPFHDSKSYTITRIGLRKLLFIMNLDKNFYRENDLYLCASLFSIPLLMSNSY